MTPMKNARLRDEKGRFTSKPDIVRNPREKRQGRKRKNSTEKTVKEDSTVKTVWIENSLLEQMDKIMLREGLTFRALVNIFCQKGVQLYRQKHGTLGNSRRSDPSDIL